MHTKLLVIGEDVEGLMEPFSEHATFGRWEDTEPDLLNFWRGTPHREVRSGATAEKMCEFFTSTGEGEYRMLNGKVQERVYFNPEGRWDYYTLGGRWGGELILKEGREGRWGYRDPFTEEGGERPVGRADAARRGDLDLDRARTEAYKAAGDRWSAYERLREQHGDGQTFDALIEVHGCDTARKLYQDQPLIKALRGAGLVPLLSRSEYEFGGLTGEQYRERAMLSAVPGWATLSDEGWIDSRQYFGPKDEQERTAEMEYLRTANTRLDAAADSELVSVIDYHS